MRLFKTVVAALLATTGLAACGGPGDAEELANEVVDRLKDNDFQGYVNDLVATPQEVLEVCPAVSSYKVDQVEQQEHFTNCLNRADFRSAEVTNVQSTLVVDPICGAGVDAAEEIRVTVSTEAAIYTFTIGGALATENGWKATGNLKCPNP